MPLSPLTKMPNLLAPEISRESIFQYSWLNSLSEASVAGSATIFGRNPVPYAVKRIGAESEPLPLGQSIPWHTLLRLSRSSSPAANVNPLTCSKLVQGESAERPSFF